MKKIILTALGVFFGAGSASANVLYLHCQRYESKCVGEKCYEIAEGLNADPEWRNALPVNKLEQLDYVVHDDKAVVITDNAMRGSLKTQDSKYTIPFNNVRQDSVRIQLEITSGSAVKERVTVIKHTGFYSAYVLHTDTSIKDIPVGTPYKAYFGWCDDTTETEGVYTPKPIEQKPAEQKPATDAPSATSAAPVTPASPANAQR